jgi:hypothetical protein
MKNIIFFSFVMLFMTFLNSCSDEEVVPQKRASSAQSDLTSDAIAGKTETNAKKAAKYLPSPISGTISGIPFTAEYQITKFVARNGQLYAIGSLQNISGVGLPPAASGIAGQQIMLPTEVVGGSTADVTTAQVGSCDILFLQLGPLDLDLLGLQVHLDQVTLEIDAQTGPGNLLGNLLCAITGLLDGAGTLTAIAELLNRIIDLIGTLP